MQEVDVTRTIDAPRPKVEAVLSPAMIVEYAGTYTVQDVSQTDDGVVVTGVTDELEIALLFTETGGPFVYRQHDDVGPFAEMYASLSMTGDRPVTVIARSCYTFGMPLARLTDRLVVRERRMELRRLVDGIEAAVRDG